MKIRNPLIGVAFAAASVIANAAPPDASPRENAVMLYFSKSFGGPVRESAPLAFGLRLQHDSSIAGVRPASLIDLRYSLGGRQQFLLGGLNMFESSDESSQASTGSEAASTFSQKHPGWTTVLIAIGIAGGLCATRTLLCEESKRYNPEIGPGPSPGL